MCKIKSVLVYYYLTKTFSEYCTTDVSIYVYRRYWPLGVKRQKVLGSKQYRLGSHETKSTMSFVSKNENIWLSGFSDLEVRHETGTNETIEYLILSLTFYIKLKIMSRCHSFRIVPGRDISSGCDYTKDRKVYEWFQ